MKIPKNLGRYEVLDLISQGGMGTLYRARDPRIGRTVAVKVLKEDFDTAELRDRFSREARAAGCLSHPNIVTIYDVGEQDGLPFIAMEYVRGETFIEILGLRPPLAVDRKLQLIEEVCAGLAHAHEAGIVHRDIKPGNLIVSSEGLVKILDFGIAKLSSAGLTMPGVIMGTLNYMAPEQAKGRPVDARTDIFAVGVVMYELLSHQPAFSGTRASDVLHKILSGTPTPITQYCPDLDPRVVQVIDRTLEKDPDQRFQSIAAVGKAIAAVRQDPENAAASWQRPTRSTRGTANTPIADPARLRADQIQEYLAAAERAFAGGDYDGAIDACKQVLMIDASNERAFAELDRIHAAVDERQAAVEAAVERGRAAFETGNMISALREVKQALALDPNDAAALALSAQTEQAIKDRQDDARIRAAVDAARRRFAAGDHRAALESLEALQPATNLLVRSALDELRRALNQIVEQQRIEAAQSDRRRRIAALAGEARAAIAGDRLDDAARILSEIRDIDPSAPELTDVAEHVRRAHAAARTREEVGRTLAEFETRVGEGDLAQAESLLNGVVGLAAGDPRIPAARQRLAEAKAALAARREGEQTLDAAAARLQAGDLAAAGEMMKRAAQLVPGHPRGAELAEQLNLALERQAAAEAAERAKREAAALVRDASAHLQLASDNAAELPIALDAVSRALELDASNPDAVRVKAEIEAAIATRREAARARTAIENAVRRFANGKHLSAIKLLEDFDPPNQPDVVKALGDLRAALKIVEEKKRAEQERIERQQRLDALVNDARAALREQRFDDALQLLATAGEIDAPSADVAPLREQVVREKAAARLRAETAAIVSEIDQRLSRGELEAARDLLGKATALSATDGAVAAARQRVDQAAAEREAAAARELAVVREREAAAARERQAAAARERDAASAPRTTARRTLAAGDPTVDPNAETLFAGNLPESVRAVIAAARGQKPPATTAQSTNISDANVDTAAVDAERARRTADELLAAARAQLQAANPSADDVTSALQKIEQALAAVPNDRDALSLKTTANETLTRLRDAMKIDAAIRNARSRFAMGKHQAAIQLLEGLDPASHPPVADALKELRAALTAVDDRRRQTEAPAKRPPAAPDDEATRVLFVSDVLGKGAPPADGATVIASADAKTPVVEPATVATPQIPSPAESQKRLLVFAGVLLLAVIVALLLLRFAS